MTDAEHPFSARDDEALSAYLAGEFDAAEAAAFEQRLADEPALARQLDALAGALVGLHGADAADVPEGFEQRLEQRLAAERREQPADLAAHRARRDRSRTWLAVGTAAAVLAATAVMAGNLLPRGDGAGVDTVAMEESAGRAGVSAGGEEMTAADEDTAAAGAAPVPGPVVIDEQAVVADEQALRQRYADVEEAEHLLGVPLAEARPLARSFAEQLGAQMSASRLSPESSATDGAATERAAGQHEDVGATAGGAAGQSPSGDPCLSTITAGAQAPLVPVRVETLRYDGTEAIAYVLVTAQPGSDVLDRTEVWVVAPEDCATLVFHQY